MIAYHPTVVAVIGAILVLAVIVDVFATVLFPGSGYGVVRKPLARLIEAAFRVPGRRTSGARRRKVLSYSGPIHISLTLAAWVLLLLVGWAAIYQPALGTSIRATRGDTDTSWASALYYSGYSLTTLGLGDMVPMTATYRLFTIAESALGFGTLTMVITYFLSVYSALTRRNAFALGLHHRTGKTGDAADLLARFSDGTALPGLRSELAGHAAFLRETFQTHRSYPVLRYFRYEQPYYALPRVLFTSLDTVTLVRTALERGRYRGVVGAPAVDEVFEAADALLAELDSGRRPPSAPHDETGWRDRYADAVARLGQAGLEVRADPDAGADEYVGIRRRWDRRIDALARSMLYEWDHRDRREAPGRS